MFRATFRRLLTLDDPPERTALAFAIGVFIAFSPFLGLHTIMATLVAFTFRFNKIAIYTGTFINNPFLTLVPIIIASYAIGAFVLGQPLRISPEGLELLKEPASVNGRLLSQTGRRRLANRLAVHHWRNGAFGRLFTHCLSSNILAVASASKRRPQN